MKKSIYVLGTSLLLGASLFFSACGGQQGSQEGEVAEEGTVMETEEEVTETVAERASPRQEISGTASGVTVNIAYGSPGVKDREIFGSLIPYDKVWRTGADEATWVSFDKAVVLGADGSVTLPAGKYGLFTVPGEATWKVTFNEVWDQWGAYDYDASKDVASITVTPQPLDSKVERLTFALNEDAISFAWANTGFSIPVKAAE